jgi:deoxyribodipyrimidine photo-lyase
MIQATRIAPLNKNSPKNGKYVLYWMQASQREEYNHALEYTIARANEMGKPVVVVFALTPNYPNAHYRHYLFMIDGLKETQAALVNRGIQLVIIIGNPAGILTKLSSDACLIVTDCGYTRIQRRWRVGVADKIERPLYQVESDIIVPVEQASAKEEYSAATIRPKINRLLSDYLIPVRRIPPKKDSLGLRFDSAKLDDITATLSELGVDMSVEPSAHYKGGLSWAKKRLDDFLEHKITEYSENKNDPSQEYLSNLSPYIHFGQISPLYIAIETLKRAKKYAAAFLEELIIRRELAINFVYFNPEYDNYTGLPDWCLNTLERHTEDKRPYLYNQAELEQANTHDPYWNAAQTEMMITGKMHGYMRMYWGKKILEWSRTPQEAYKTAIYLNDKYELDGRDPNGYAGVAWCFGKHDRPWARRPIFGNIRYMNDAGLRRKFDIDEYVKKIERLKNKPL